MLAGREWWSWKLWAGFRVFRRSGSAGLGRASRRRGLQALILVGLALAGGPLSATEPDDSVVNWIVELNKRALVLYGNLDVTGAADRLQEALALCQQVDLATHPVAARTHLHLGVVYVGGLKKRDEGLEEFKRALAIDPKIKIAKSLENPEVREVFAEAQAFPLAAANAGEAGSAALAGEHRRDRPGIHHPRVTKAIRGRAVAVKVQVPPGLGASKVVLAYRAEGADVFLAREMTPVADAAGWYQAEIPAEATQAPRVSYYLEAQNPDDQAIASSGTPERPHRIFLTPEVPVEDTLGLPPVPPTVPAPASAAAPGLWLVLAVGGGAGYHSGTPEMNPVDSQSPPQSVHVSGFGLARLIHLAPEIGFFPRERLVLSVQARLQFVGGTQEVEVGQRIYHPARLALAGLGKVTWFARKGRPRLRPFIVLEAGAGQIRHAVTTPASAQLSDCGDGPTCKDTVMGGLGLWGAGAGVLWMLDRYFAAYAALNVLVGLPNTMVNGDVNLGIALLR